jgi:endoglucanase
MRHLYDLYKVNTFRLPVTWQYLLNNIIGVPLDPIMSGYYDQLVQSCLSTGPDVYCIIDLHNYGRWWGGIVGQGGPTDAQFASLWSQLGQRYAAEPRVIFGLMNEPHDMPDITLWAASCQAAVTAIRQAGATSQMILLPGNHWASAGWFLIDGSAAALSQVTNPDGSKTNLVFDLHKYLDFDNSGTHTDCVTNNIDDAFGPVATWLRQEGRQALLSETHSGVNAPCFEFFCQQTQFMDENSDVYLGYVLWAGGSFDSSYPFSLIHPASGGGWNVSPLVVNFLAR